MPISSACKRKWLFRKSLEEVKFKFKTREIVSFLTSTVVRVGSINNGFENIIVSNSAWVAPVQYRGASLS